MKELLGIVYAYHSQPRLGELVARRTGASLPFCSRYRAIDFALSGLMNAGVRDVGVVMQRDYQSLLDHLGNGRDWDLTRRGGGLRLLPPFGLPDDVHTGSYSGCVEALLSVSSYIAGSGAEYVMLQRGNLIANLDVADILHSHISSGVDITSVCREKTPAGIHHRYVTDKQDIATKLLCRRVGDGPGVPALEVYIIKKDLLLTLLGRARAMGWKHFHRELMRGYIADGGTVGVYMHSGFAVYLETVGDYYAANMDMLDTGVRAELFPASRPVRTKERADVSTYYGPRARVKNCLVADGCYIEGDLENCVLFRGARVERGAVLRGSIIMQDTSVGQGAVLDRVIADKNVTISPNARVSGEEEPLVIPKGASV